MTEDQAKQMEEAPFPISFTCVDGIIQHNNEILFIKKSNKDDLYRLPGGMVDTTDLTFKEAVRREMKEETNLLSANSENARQLGEFLMFDKGRYDSGTSKHRLRTILFDIPVEFDRSARYYDMKAGDDATDIKWISINKLYDIAWVTRNVMAGHIPLLYYWLGSKHE